VKLDVTDCQILSLDSGVIDCPITAAQVPVVFMTIRITGQAEPVNLAIRNPHRLAEDLPIVMERSNVLNGGEFVSEHAEDDQ
jgi:hypothetical protein